MKHFYLWMIIPFLFSCTMDNEKSNTQSIAPNHRTAGFPENISNEYDTAGKLHYDLCEAFDISPSVISSLHEAVSATNGLAVGSQDFQLIVPGNYVSPSEQQLSYIIENPQRPVDVINQLALSGKGKTSLLNFVNTLDFFKSQGMTYDEIYSFIVSYEDSINQDVSFGEVDRKIIFTTTSIARYAHYFTERRKKKKPVRDKDWDVSIGNLVAGSDGSQESTAKAVSMSVAVGLYNNK
ncbi:MAG: hypothetical protein EOO46_00320 [Flavobacterium sp.]|nr:MAG: hypothetical protein EOO46_00320 [Flavobacterium sp.]